MTKDSKIFPVLFVVDASGNMEGEKINTINELLPQIIQRFKDDYTSDREILIGILKYSTNSEWVTNYFEPIETFKWKEINPGGCVDLGSALRKIELNCTEGKLIGFNSNTLYPPVVVFFNSLEPSDNVYKYIDTLSHQYWYKRACKFAVGIGEDWDIEVLKQLTQTPETIFTLENFIQGDFDLFFDFINKIPEDDSWITEEDDDKEYCDSEIVSHLKEKNFEIALENIVYELDDEMQVQMCVCDTCPPEKALIPVLNVKYVLAETEHLEVRNLGMDISGKTYMVEYFIPSYSVRKVKNTSAGFELNSQDYALDGKIFIRYSSTDDCMLIDNRTPKNIYVCTTFNTNDIVTMVGCDRIIRLDGKIVLKVNEELIEKENEIDWGLEW